MTVVTERTEFTQPYPGIRPFRKSEWPIFFGRDRMIDAVMEKLAKCQFVLLHGTSGCGKSSLVKAGLLPRLEMSHYGHDITWRTAQMRPGGAPLWNFAELLARIIEGLEDDQTPSFDMVRTVRRRLNLGIKALPSLAEEFGIGATGNVCLLIDQFEEIFRFAAEIERSEVDMLIEVLRVFEKDPPRGMHVIATMRSDFLGDCAKFVGFAEVINQTQYLLPRLEQSELMESIIRPAELFDGEVEIELALKLIDESRDEADALPLVQHCLMYLWNRASSEQSEQIKLGLDGYLGLKQTLSQRADEVLEELETSSPGAGKSAEHLFRSVVEQDASGRATRRPIRRSVLQDICASSSSELDLYIERFSHPDTGFLLLSDDDDPIVDITHESLIRCWDRLSGADKRGAGNSGWLQRERDDARMWRALVLRAEEGEEIRDESAIIEREKMLSSLPSQAWTERYGGRWDDVTALLSSSRAKIDEIKTKDKQDADRRRLIVSGAFVALVAGIATIGSLWSSASDSRSRVQDVLWENLVSRWDRAVSPTIWEAEGVTNASIDSTDVRAQIGLYILDTGRIDVENTSGLASELRTSLSVKLRDFRVASEALEPIFETQFAVYDGEPQEVDGVTISFDGKYVAAGDDAGHVVIWDASAGYAEGQIRQIDRIVAHSDQVGQVRFEPNGYRLLSVGYDGKAKIWDAQTGDLVKAYDSPGRNWGSAWSQDGKKFATGADRGTARVYDFSAPERDAPLFEIDSRSELAMGVAFNPTADRLAVAPVKEGIQIYDISGAERALQSNAPAAPEQIDEVGEGELFSVEWSRDGRLLASGLDNGDMLVWSAEGEQQELARMNNVQAARGLSFRSDNAYLATGSDAGEARVWSLPDGALVAELRGHSDDVDSIAWTPDNQHIVTGTDDGFIRIFRFEAPDFSKPISTVIEQTKQRFSTSSASGDSRSAGNICLSQEQWKQLVGASMAPDWCRSSEQKVEDSIRALGDQVNASPRADRSTLDGLVAQTSEEQVFEQLVEAASLTQLRISGKNKRARIAKRYIDLARAFVSPEQPERAARLAFLEMEFGADGPGDLETRKLLAMESISHGDWPAGSAIFDRADAASFFANVPVDLNSAAPDQADPSSSNRQIRALSTDMVFANLAVASNDGLIFLWDLTSKSMETLLETNDGAVVYDVAINPAGNLVAAALADGQFILIDLLNDRAVSNIGAYARDPRSIAWSRNGQVLATGGDEEIARIWKMDGNQVSDGEPVELIGHTGGVRSIALSADGNYVLTGASDATARVWDARTGTSKFSIKHKGAIDAVDYSAPRDDRTSLLAVGGADNVVDLWRITADGDVKDLENQLSFASNVQDVAFSRDGNYLAVASSSVSVWDVTTGKRRLTLDVEDVTALSWASDGTELLTGSRVGHVQRFTFDPGTLAQRADASLARCLEPGERRELGLVDKIPEWCARIQR